MAMHATRKQSQLMLSAVNKTVDAIESYAMRLLILAMAFFLFCQPAQSLEQSQPAQASFTIAIPFALNSPPYMWRDHNSNKMMGSVIDAYELIAEQQGYQLHWYFYSPNKSNSQLLKDYQAGNIDIFISPIPKIIPRQDLRKIDTHIASVTMHAFLHTDSILADLSIEALPQYNGIIGPMVNLHLREMDNKHAVLVDLKLEQMVSANDLQTILNALEQKKSDYSIGERPIVSVRLRELGLNHQYQIMEPALGTIPTIMHFRLGSGFEHYLEGFYERSTLFNRNGRLNHIKEKNMRLYFNEAKRSTYGETKR